MVVILIIPLLNCVGNKSYSYAFMYCYLELLLIPALYISVVICLNYVNPVQHL